ncbi:MAG: hypothetical protein ACRDK0_11125 [Solirubrobacteraceae bacterium]
MSIPRFGDIERFCRIDGWQQDTSVGGSRQRHIRYEKQVTGQAALRTQVSHDRSSTPSPGRWKAILRNQLKITEEQFWEALRSGDPVDRTPPPPPPTPTPVVDWVREGLRRAGLRDEQIDALEDVEAQQELYRLWSGGGPP